MQKNIIHLKIKNRKIEKKKKEEERKTGKKGKLHRTEKAQRRGRCL